VIAAILRIVLLLLPVVAVLMWLRWRMRTDRTEDDLVRDVATLRKTLVILILVAVGAGLGLKFTDSNTGAPGTKYIPPHSENGRVVPGRLVPADEEPAEADKTNPESDDQREQDPG
jgi:hypothetical protein